LLILAVPVTRVTEHENILHIKDDRINKIPGLALWYIRNVNHIWNLPIIAGRLVYYISKKSHLGGPSAIQIKSGLATEAEK
jgi:hypothetical protein